MVTVDTATPQSAAPAAPTSRTPGQEAGGLTPGNVGEAVARLAPDVVDVSSGVEAALGRKSVVRLRRFVRAARGTEC
jgi:phosphoribosylanthranilate isomerase